MRAENNDARDASRIRAEVLRQAARIAEAEESLLAAEYWNRACQRIAQRLEAQAARLEAIISETPAAPERVDHIRHQCRTPTTRCRGRRNL